MSPRESPGKYDPNSPDYGLDPMEDPGHTHSGGTLGGGWNAVYLPNGSDPYDASPGDLVLSDGIQVNLNAGVLGAQVAIMAFLNQVTVTDTVHSVGFTVGPGILGCIFVLTPDIGGDELPGWWHKLDEDANGLDGDVNGALADNEVTFIQGVPIYTNAGDPNVVITSFTSSGALCIDTETPALWQAFQGIDEGGALAWVPVVSADLPVSRQPVGTPTGVIQALPPLNGFTFTGASIDFPLEGAIPTAICVGFDHNLWVTDSNGFVWRITPSGVATSFPLEGAAPVAICSGSDGNLWVVDQNNGGAVWQVTPDGTATMFALPAGGPPIVPVAIAASPAGNMWVVGNNAPGEPGATWLLETDGSSVQIGYPGNNATGVCAGNGDYMWLLFGPTGPGIQLWNLLGGAGRSTVLTDAIPVAVCTGPDGNAWVADSTGFVWRVKPDLTADQFPLEGASPVDICSGGGGDLWVADANGGLWKVTVDGEVTKFDHSGSNVGICSGSDGSLWVTDSANAEVTAWPFTMVLGSIQSTGMPTADPHVVGAFWNNSGVVNVSAG